MRYFEIAKPPARQILACADPKIIAASERRSDKGEIPKVRGMPNCLNRINRQSRRQHLSPQRSQ
jgi:hypothetical protein